MRRPVPGLREVGLPWREGAMTKPAGSQLVTVVVCVAALYAGQAFGAERLVIGNAAPELTATPWVNGGPVTIAGSKGHVVVLEFLESG
jgi:hypothetical protein